MPPSQLVLRPIHGKAMGFVAYVLLATGLACVTSIPIWFGVIYLIEMYGPLEDLLTPFLVVFGVCTLLIGTWLYKKSYLPRATQELRFVDIGLQLVRNSHVDLIRWEEVEALQFPDFTKCIIHTSKGRTLSFSIDTWPPQLVPALINQCIPALVQRHATLLGRGTPICFKESTMWAIRHLVFGMISIALGLYGAAVTIFLLSTDLNNFPKTKKTFAIGLGGLVIGAWFLTLAIRTFRGGFIATRTGVRPAPSSTSAELTWSSVQAVEASDAGLYVKDAKGATRVRLSRSAPNFLVAVRLLEELRSGR